MYYFLVGFVIFLLAFFCYSPYVTNSNNRNEIRFLISSFVYLLVVFFIGFRFESGGPDWIAYKQFFEYVEPATKFYTSTYWQNIGSHGFEPLFKVYASIIKVFSNNYIYLNLFSAVISLFVLFRFYHKATIYPVIAVFLYFCSYSLLGDMTVVRQILAASIFIFSLDDVKERKFFSFSVKIFFAILFHYSAVIVLLFYLAYPLLNNRWFTCISAVLLFYFFVFWGGFTTILIKSLLSVFLGFNDALAFKLAQYLKEASVAEMTLGIGFIERSILFIACIIFKDKIIKRFDVYGNLILNLFMFNYLVSLVFLDFSVFYSRFRYYFVFCVPVLYTYFLVLVKQRAFPFLVYFWYGVLWIYLTVYSAPQMYIPYQNYFGEILGFEHVNREKMIEDGYE